MYQIMRREATREQWLNMNRTTREPQNTPGNKHTNSNGVDTVGRGTHNNSNKNGENNNTSFQGDGDD
jgi:hypothetical protein